MNRIPGAIRTDQQPPMAIPLGHFVVGLAFLVVGAVGGTAMTATTLPGLASLAHVHVLLVGWIAITIMGAMTQFVPVWSGVSIHSRRLAVAQLLLVAAGLAGFATALLAGAMSVLPLAGAAILLGIWTFVYNVGRTLVRARPLDLTERHFAFALAAFALLVPLGFLLALDFSTDVFGAIDATRGDVLLVHATVALYGGVLATVVGALAQLVLMFTQTDRTALDERLLVLEQLCFPAGVAVLVAGRGLGSTPVTRVGGLAVLLGLAAFTVVLARQLARATVDRSPMTDRYWVVAASLWAWLALTASAWWLEPAGYATLFGHPDANAVLLYGVFGFVVVGSLYHIVPFIVWHERYSDRLGFERVPMIDDLYDDRLERADFALMLVGYLGLAAGPLFDLPAVVTTVSTAVLALGLCLFVLNVLLTIRRHGSNGIAGVLTGLLESDDDASADAAEPDVGVLPDR
ncbi:hypothetical protein [Haloterrigena alkaliphila]|uniref:Uncharacterized protein n=1 Tax=Haloterrigena alkaliphila TaxID=2816475 RepID=A0A8A2VEH4_9EURY|nr:hypothetical protein [Haloterrigena alkaliphila]QSW98762.1 hypothetical protein J0X25_15400 [Haloterrigena alkaliphila]